MVKYKVARVLLVCLIALSSLLAQPGTFAIEKQKPFVYVKFDHFGSMKVTPQRETSNLWLRLVNNCRLSIVVLANDLGKGVPGVALNYEVVREGGFQEGQRETIQSPKGNSFHVGSRLTIAPGKDLLFSVPSNHVSEDWHIELDFAFGLPDPRDGVNPRGIVTFGWDRIPTKDRAIYMARPGT